MFFFSILVGLMSYAGTDGLLRGKVTCAHGPVSGASIRVMNHGQEVRGVLSDEEGGFVLFPVPLGDYTLIVDAPSTVKTELSVHVSSQEQESFVIYLQEEDDDGVQEVHIEASRKLIQKSASMSRTEVASVERLVQGSEVPFTKLLAGTTPGVVEGSFGQLYVRGNHSNIQYQIDGVLLPDSSSGNFSRVFSVRNMERMEVVTGGVPAEYGQRLNAVINMVSKSGTLEPGGEVELNYGSYSTLSPHILGSGSLLNGKMRAFMSINYNQSARALNTPQPKSLEDQGSGGGDAIHDFGSGLAEYLKLDWSLSHTGHLSLIVLNQFQSYQIPNYPSSFSPSSPYFQNGYKDRFGNTSSEGPVFQYRPIATDDRQQEYNTYLAISYKKIYDNHMVLQASPFFKYSAIKVIADPVNDLASSEVGGSSPIVNSDPMSFALDKKTSTFGLKSDLTSVLGERDVVKKGVLMQASKTLGSISTLSLIGRAPLSDSTPVSGYMEGVYIQDDHTFLPGLVANVGLRYDAVQFVFTGVENNAPTDSMLQPRLGLNYMLTPDTKLHVFYGKLFQPAPMEALRYSFNRASLGPKPYDILSEKDDYVELGIAQEYAGHVTGLTVYYKKAINMQDSGQVENTTISQVFNYADGFAYGIEWYLRGQMSRDWSDFLSYAYSIAKGRGISGGMWAAHDPNVPDYQLLDHVQVHTANGGIQYAKNNYWWTLQGVLGSGFRTGEHNDIPLPLHVTFDTTVGYKLLLDKARVSFDILNIFDYSYPITISNAYNNSQYAAGRQFFVRFVSEF